MYRVQPVLTSVIHIQFNNFILLIQFFKKPLASSHSHTILLLICCCTGDNVDALFTRIATVAFESVVMREVELLSQPSNGQLTQNSTLISK